MIADSSRLWSKVSCTDTLVFVRKAVQRSKSHPLEISYDRQSGAKCPWTDFFVEMSPHLERWKTASFRIERADLAQFRELEDRSAPTLESLSIRGDFWDPGDWNIWPPLPIAERAELPIPTMDLFTGGTDNLRHLKLIDVVIPYTSRLLKGLKSLELSSRTPITPSEALALLVNNPSLEVLSIPLQVSSTSTDTTLAPIQLNHLRQINFHHCTQTAVEFILPLIHAPLLRALTISTVGRKNPISPPSLPRLTTVKTLISFMARYPTISKLSQHKLLLRVVSPFPETYRQKLYRRSGIDRSLTDMAVMPEHLDEVVNHIMACFPEVEVGIRIDHPTLGAAENARVFSTLNRLPRVTRMRICNEYEPENPDLEPFIAQLVKPVVVNGRAQWYLPDLESLSLGDASAAPFVLPMVRARYASGETRPFKKLCLWMGEAGSLDDEDVQRELVGLVGAECLELAPYGEPLRGSGERSDWEMDDIDL